MRLTIKDCNIIRGISISIIVLHNYCHQLPGAIRENEFYYSKENHDAFMNALCGLTFFEGSISYWGYLGVIAFVFLSGYGLSLKYDHQKFIDKTDFIWKHYKKLVIPLILGIIAYQIVFYAANDHLNGSVLHTLAQSTALFNMIYPHGIYIFPGPYWYVGMAFELYLVYLFCIHRKSWIWPVGLTLLCLIYMELAKNYDVIIIKWVRHNAIGWMLPFVMGVIMARYSVDGFQSRTTYGTLFVLSCVMILLLDNNFLLWMLIPIMAIMWIVSLTRLMPSCLKVFFSYIGELSMIVYFVHPVIRTLVSQILMPRGYTGLTVYVGLTLMVSWLLRYFMRYFKRTFC